MATAQASAVVEPTRILVFGQSNTAGSQLGDGEAAWPQLLAAALGQRAAITVRTFYAHAPGALAYLEGELEKHEPEIVIVTLTPFAFLVPVVGPGVRRRFGDRAGNAWTWLESRLDRATRHGGRLRTSLNHAARRLSHAVLGAAPVASYETVTDGYRQSLSRLVREERLQVLALQGPARPYHPGGRSGERERELLQRYAGEMRALTSGLHVPHIDLMSTYTDTTGMYMPDATHVTAETQKLVAAAVIAAFEDRRLQLRAADVGRA
jgi:hypothetical protein